MKKALFAVIAAATMLSACSTAHKVIDGAENLGSKVVQGVENVSTDVKNGVENTLGDTQKLSLQDALKACQAEVAGQDSAAFDACMKAKGFEKPATTPADQATSGSATATPAQSEAPAVVPATAKIAG